MIVKAYLCGSVPVQNSFLELREFQRRYDSQDTTTGRAGRRAYHEGARGRDSGRWHFGLRSALDTDPA